MSSSLMAVICIKIDFKENYIWVKINSQEINCKMTVMSNTVYGRRHSKLFINCHVSWDTLYILLYQICLGISNTLRTFTKPYELYMGDTCYARRIFNRAHWRFTSFFRAYAWKLLEQSEIILNGLTWPSIKWAINLLLF